MLQFVVAAVLFLAILMLVWYWGYRTGEGRLQNVLCREMTLKAKFNRAMRALRWLQVQAPEHEGLLRALQDIDTMEREEMERRTL